MVPLLMVQNVSITTANAPDLGLKAHLSILTMHEFLHHGQYASANTWLILKNYIKLKVKKL